MNETVITYDDYTQVTDQDFQVIFVKYSEEDDQNMTFEIVEVKASSITVQLTFEDSMLVSQGIDSDEVVVKLNKDLFLAPVRYASVNS